MPLGTQSRQHVPVLVFATWSLLKGISSAKSRVPAWGQLEGLAGASLSLSIWKFLGLFSSLGVLRTDFSPSFRFCYLQ